MSKYFNDVNQAIEILLETFQRAIKNPEIAKLINDLNQLFYFDYTQDNPIASFYIDTRKVTKIKSGIPPDKPDVTIINNLDTAHNIWSNKINPVLATATGKIKTKGSTGALLKLVPLLKYITPIYKQVLKEKGLLL